MRLNGKVAIVTGASQGLGQHLAIELAREGAHVVVAARNADRLTAVQAQIESNGGTAHAVPTDLTDEEGCRLLVERTVELYGRIDILILNAGFATYGRLEELMTLESIRDAVNVNLFGAALPTHYALEELIARKGLIAYVTSGAGHMPLAGYLGYTTSKHAMNGFFEALRLEVADQGVDVLAINPGDMYNEDGAGRSVLGPDGSQHKVDLSERRTNDIPRVPARQVAAECMPAILERRRDVDLSPLIQKVGTRARVFAPGLVDRRIKTKARNMRAAFDGLAAEQHLLLHPHYRADCPLCRDRVPSS